MAVTRADRELELQQLETAFKGTESAVLVDYKGMNVPQVTELRRQLRIVKASYKVVKNTLARRALKGTALEPLEHPGRELEAPRPDALDADLQRRAHAGAGGVDGLDRRSPLLEAARPRGGHVALAAGHRHRVYDAVILKTLGATRARLLGAYALEYLMIGFATAVFGVIAGSVAAWLIVTRLMTLSFIWQAGSAAGVVAAALVVTVGLGLAGTLLALNQKPAAVLRNL